jgi:tripartite-type tricarboxylate transporter receptor subunit TctC
LRVHYSPGLYWIFAPLETPKSNVATLSAEIARLLATREARGFLAKFGVNVHGGSLEEVAAYIREEDAKWEIPIIASQK